MEGCILKHRTIAVFTLAVALFSLAVPLAAADYPQLLVVNRKSNNVVIINAETGETVDAIRIGRRPAEIVLSPDEKTAYVSNFGDNRNFLSVIDVAKRKEVARWDVKPTYRPHGMALSKDGRRLYVTTEGTRTVTLVGTDSGKVLGSYKTNEKVTHMVALSPAEDWLYTTNGATGNVSVFNLKTGKLKKHILSGPGCEGIAVNKDGSEVWVSNRRQDSIVVIDTELHKEKKKFPCHGYPVRIRFTPDGKRVLVSCAADNEISVFDAATYEKVGGASTGLVPVGMDITPDGSRAYAACNGDNTVSVIDLKTLKKTDEFFAGEYPISLVYVEGK
jgi:YVTN family beta-propeller protein